VIGIPLGLLGANAAEWVFHKYVLHGLGRKRKSYWSFHWLEHHRVVRTNEFIDPDYQRSVFGAHAQGKEAAALATAAVLTLPLAPVAPFFTGTVLYCMWNYYRKHKRAHLDPDWAREHLPWHYDHHMAPDQDANWCVTKPWFDHVMGTRKPYLGTERERQDRERAEKRKARKVEQESADSSEVPERAA
jgi:sterol desaturase/sphingolipid hydroxylase (fatty acid hydroxylase superfamily)